MKAYWFSRRAMDTILPPEYSLLTRVERAYFMGGLIQMLIEREVRGRSFLRIEKQPVNFELITIDDVVWIDREGL